MKLIIFSTRYEADLLLKHYVPSKKRRKQSNYIKTDKIHILITGFKIEYGIPNITDIYDKIYVVGFACGNKNTKIGDIIHVDTVIYKNNSIQLKSNINKNILMTSDNWIDNINLFKTVKCGDMETYHILNKLFPLLNKIECFRIITDHGNEKEKEKFHQECRKKLTDYIITKITF